MATNRETFIIEGEDRTVHAFKTIMKNAQKMADEGNRVSRNWGNVGGILTGISVGFLAREIDQVVTSVDGLAKSAKVAGVLPETLQELRYAFGQLADISGEEVDKALETFNTRLGMAIELGGPAKDTFRELGVEMRDNTGAFKSSEQMLDEVLVKLSGIENGSVRAAKASEIFGKQAGPVLAQALGEGGQTLDDMRQRAHELGLVLDNDLVTGAEEAADRIDDMKRSIGTQFQTVVLQNTDLIIDLANAGLQVAVAFGQAAGTAVEFYNSLKHDDAAKELTSNLERQAELEQQIANVRKNAAEQSDGRRRNPARAAAEKEMLAGMEKELEYLNSLEAGLQQRVKDQADAHRIAEQEKKDAAEKAAAEKNLAAVRAAAAADRRQQSAAESKALSEVHDIFTPAAKKAIENNKVRHKELEKVHEDAKAVFESTRTEVEKYNAELERLGILLERGAIEQEWYDRAVLNAARELNKTKEVTKETESAVRDLGLTFTSAAEEAVVGGQKISDVIRGLLEDLAKLAFRKLVTEQIVGAVTSAFSGSMGGTSVKGLWGQELGVIPGYRAAGGPVSGGSPYIVGEQGPELFVPGGNGSIVPNNQLGGMTVQVNVGGIDARGADAGAVNSLRAYLDNEFAPRILAIAKRQSTQNTMNTITRPRFA